MTLFPPIERPAADRMPLPALRPGQFGIIVEIGRGSGEGLEQRLLEIGFEEGKEVEVLHVGPFGGDPLAVRVDGMTVAIRRDEARAVLVDPLR